VVTIFEVPVAALVHVQESNTKRVEGREGLCVVAIQREREERRKIGKEEKGGREGGREGRTYPGLVLAI